MTFFCWMLDQTRRGNWNRTMTALTQCGIRYESFTDTCVNDLRKYNFSLEYSIYTHYKVTLNADAVERYVSSDAGKRIKIKIIRAIYNCSDWRQFYDTFNYKSKFHKVVKTQIKHDMKKFIPWKTRLDIFERMFLWERV